MVKYDYGFHQTYIQLYIRDVLIQSNFRNTKNVNILLLQLGMFFQEYLISTFLKDSVIGSFKTVAAVAGGHVT